MKISKCLSETLIIENFGPIKSVELELKKVTVLIGEQGTGKSAIAKLLYVLSSYFFLFGTEDERNTIIESYGLFFKPETIIKYSTDYYAVLRREGKFIVELNSDVKHTHDNFGEKPNSIRYEWFDRLIGDYKYVPAERIALTSILRMLNAPSRVLYGGSFDEFLADFARDYDAARRKITDYPMPHLNNVFFKMVNGIEKVVFNNEELFLDQTSSGFQVSIPLVIFIAFYTQIKSIHKFIIEEPELNLFPSAQNELIKFFVEKINPANFSIILTTHSPYTLTSLNNLIYACQVGQKHKERVNQIIEEEYWINPADVSAYMLKSDGYGATDIMDREVNQIDAGSIDGISRQINEDWDDILKIEVDGK